LVLPLLLVAFTSRVEIPVTIAASPIVGLILGGAGILVVAWGMWDIWSRGGGLPMNAFPPKRLVTGGIYSVIPHPIYSGAVVLCAGVSLCLGSAAGLMLTTPLVAACALALVLGHERPHLLRTFGALPDPRLGVARVLGPAARALRLDRAAVRILLLTERLANSWRAWPIGRARVVNHAVFAGLAGGVGAFLVTLVAGADHAPAVALIGLAGVLGAAAFGQLMVGSSRGLSRPFGYFGGLLGIAAAGLVLSAFDSSVQLVLAAFALAGPWMQAIGRLRCVVQGCCHGAPTLAADRGIVVDNEHSRVVLAGLKGTVIYPTQLYSILGNMAAAAGLACLWVLGASLTLIIGLYLVLGGLVRFVEEGYRGEPLTKIVAGLHSYQWFAAAMVGAGLVVLTLDAPGAPAVTASGLPPALGMGVVFFIVCGLAMGVDVPASRRRFSRLSG
jgi:phosphatidylglycerol:prolipoprotein diacylglycerol transferase